MEELPETTPASPEPTSGGLDMGALQPWHVLVLLGLIVVIGAVVLTIVLVANASRKPRHPNPPMYPPPGPQQWQGHQPPGPGAAPYPPGTEPPRYPPGTPPQPPG
jgi:hypothetical protein